jgi:hypothetical protein
MSSTSKFEVAAIVPELLKPGHTELYNFSKTGHTELYNFSKTWKRYLNICKECNAVLSEGQNMIPASLMSYIDPDLLQNLVWMEKIEGCDDADNGKDAPLSSLLAHIRVERTDDGDRCCLRRYIFGRLLSCRRRQAVTVAV